MHLDAARGVWFRRSGAETRRTHTADVDPQAWKIVDGKLYLNYSKRVERLWEEDVPGNIRKADGHWPGLREKEQ